MIRNYLLQRRWYRRLFNQYTYYLNKGTWKNLDNFIIGEKVESIEGDWNTQFFCDCGNELVHSQSFVSNPITKHNGDIYKYKCSYCKKESYANPNLIPGLLSCDKNGVPLNNTDRV